MHKLDFNIYGIFIRFINYIYKKKKIIYLQFSKNQFRIEFKSQTKTVYLITGIKLGLLYNHFKVQKDKGQR